MKLGGPHDHDPIHTDASKSVGYSPHVYQPYFSFFFKPLRECVTRGRYCCLIECAIEDHRD